MPVRHTIPLGIVIFLVLFAFYIYLNKISIYSVLGTTFRPTYTVVGPYGKAIPYVDTMASFWLPDRTFSEWELFDYICVCQCI